MGTVSLPPVNKCNLQWIIYVELQRKNSEALDFFWCGGLLEKTYLLLEMLSCIVEVRRVAEDASYSAHLNV